MNDIHVGRSLGCSSNIRTQTIHFHQFSCLEQRPLQYVDSPIFTAFGFGWFLRLFPRGEISSMKEGREIVGVYLFLRGQPSASHDCDSLVNCSLHVPRRRKHTAHESIQKALSTFKKGWGFDNIGSRRVIVKGCVDDTLTVVVTVQVCQKSSRQQDWKSKGMFEKTCLTKEGIPDIVFVVGKQKVAFQAHIMLLRQRAPIMAGMIALSSEQRSIVVNGKESDMGTARTLTNASKSGSAFCDKRSPCEASHSATDQVYLGTIDPSHFRILLRFIYERDDTCLDDEKDPKQLLSVANKFGCWELKILAEKKLIKDDLTRDSCIDMLLYAEAHSCAFLKEAAVDCIVHNARFMICNPEYVKLLESKELMGEIRRIALRDSAERATVTVTDRFSCMSISRLYCELESAGEQIEMDESRFTMLKRLRATTKQNSTEK